MAVDGTQKNKNRPPLVLTVGHSTHPIEEFIHLLQAHEVSRVVDVRTIPRSLHNPQFNKDSLPKSDALLIRGIQAEDIMSPAHRQEHKLTPFAKARGTTLTYPPEPGSGGTEQSELPF